MTDESTASATKRENKLGNTLRIAVGPVASFHSPGIPRQKMHTWGYAFLASSGRPGGRALPCPPSCRSRLARCGGRGEYTIPRNRAQLGRLLGLHRVTRAAGERRGPALCVPAQCFFKSRKSRKSRKSIFRDGKRNRTRHVGCGTSAIKTG